MVKYVLPKIGRGTKTAGISVALWAVKILKRSSTCLYSCASIMLSVNVILVILCSNCGHTWSWKREKKTGAVLTSSVSKPRLWAQIHSRTDLKQTEAENVHGGDPVAAGEAAPSPSPDLGWWWPVKMAEEYLNVALVDTKTLSQISPVAFHTMLNCPCMLPRIIFEINCAPSRSRPPWRYRSRALVGEWIHFQKSFPFWIPTNPRWSKQM